MPAAENALLRGDVEEARDVIPTCMGEPPEPTEEGNFVMGLFFDLRLGIAAGAQVDVLRLKAGAAGCTEAQMSELWDRVAEVERITAKYRPRVPHGR